MSTNFTKPLFKYKQKNSENLWSYSLESTLCLCVKSIHKKTSRRIKELVKKNWKKKLIELLYISYQEFQRLANLTHEINRNTNFGKSPPNKSIFNRHLLYLVYWTNPWNRHVKMINIRKRKQKNAPTGGWPTPGCSPPRPPSTWAWFVTTSGRNLLLKVFTWLACWLGVLRLEQWLTGLVEKSRWVKYKTRSSTKNFPWN